MPSLGNAMTTDLKRKKRQQQQQTLELEMTCRPKRYSVLGMNITNEINIHPKGMKIQTGYSFDLEFSYVNENILPLGSTRFAGAF